MAISSALTNYENGIIQNHKQALKELTGGQDIQQELFLYYGAKYYKRICFLLITI